MGNLFYVCTFRFAFRVSKPLKPTFYIHASPNLVAILDLAAILFLMAILNWSQFQMEDLVYIGTFYIAFWSFKSLKAAHYNIVDTNLAAILDLAAILNLGQR